MTTVELPGEQLSLLTDEDLRALTYDEDTVVDCLDCGVHTVKLGEYYMLRDEVWEAVATRYAGIRNWGMLCIGCVEERLGRRLRPGDFEGIPMNHDERGSPRLRSRVNETRLPRTGGHGVRAGTRHVPAHLPDHP